MFDSAEKRGQPKRLISSTSFRLCLNNRDKWNFSIQKWEFTKRHSRPQKFLGSLFGKAPSPSRAR